MRVQASVPEASPIRAARGGGSRRAAPAVIGGRDRGRTHDVGGDVRFRSLLDVAERLSMSFERGELNRTIVDAAVHLTGADHVILRDLSEGQLKTVAWSGIDDAIALRLPAIDPAMSPIKAILTAARPWVADDLQRLPPEQRIDLTAGTLEIRGKVLVPLIHSGQLIGSLTVATAVPYHWTDEDVEVLSALGTHAGLALNNAALFGRLEGRAAQLAVVQAASARMNRATTVEAIGRAIGEEVGAIFDYHNARVYVLEQPDDLVPIAFEGKIGEYEIVDWSVLRVKVGEGFTGWVAAHGTPLCIRDANADPRGTQIPGTVEVTESMLVVPMRHDKTVVGVITLSKLGLNQFDDDDLQVLTILADQAATTLESARLLTKTETLAAELRQLLDLSQELSGSLDPREVAVVLARHLQTALGVDSCTISSLDVSGNRLLSLGEYPDRGAVAANPSYDLADFPQTRRVLEHQTTLIVDALDPAADPAEVEILRLADDRVLAMVPLIAKGQSVGLIELYSKEFVDFDAGRLALARTMANEAAMALENARLYEAARSLADRDPLTGFFNHRFLYERLGEEFVRARRGRQPLSLILLDVDDFKLVNDTFGHQFGDRCLVHLAEVVRATLRLSDVPARYGGDEFAVILPDTGPEAAEAVAERIVEALQNSPVVTEGRGPVPVGVSIGVASLGTAIRTPTELVGAADARMYAAKLATHALEVEQLTEADRSSA